MSTNREISVEEAQYLLDYKQKVQSGFYPVQMITVDPVVVWRNKILLVTRGDFPGKGLLALPGGFVNTNEKLLDAAIRECREETGVSVQEGWLYRTQYYDDPNRSSRGRILTHAFAFEVPFFCDEPKVEAGDDASEASWHDIYEVLGRGSHDHSIFHDDHFWIVLDMLSKKKYNTL